VNLNWHPFPYLVHYFWALVKIGPWSKVVHYTLKSSPIGFNLGYRLSFTQGRGIKENPLDRREGGSEGCPESLPGRGRGIGGLPRVQRASQAEGEVSEGLPREPRRQRVRDRRAAQSAKSLPGRGRGFGGLPREPPRQCTSGRVTG
jgi:hypothetical protein